MVRTVYEALSPGANSSALIQRALPLLMSEHQYWTTAPKAVRLQGKDGTVHQLSRCGA